MRRAIRPVCPILACCLLASTGAVLLAGQAPPPPEMKPWMVMDVGSIPAPSSCGAVTRPFAVTPPRPGYGYGNGLAAPDSDAPITPAAARFQARRDVEERVTLPISVENGLVGNPHDSIAIAFILSASS